MKRKPYPLTKLVTQKTYWLFIAATIYDLTLTIHYISKTGSQDGNPIVQYFIETLGLFYGAVSVKVLAIIAVTAYVSLLAMSALPYSYSEDYEDSLKFVLLTASFLTFIAGSTWLLP